MNVDELSSTLAAVASPQRIRILATLVPGRLHVSELARQVEMSRALLYMHLAKLEQAGFVGSALELSDDGRALKFFSVLPFTFTIDAATMVAAVTNHTESEN